MSNLDHEAISALDLAKELWQLCKDAVKGNHHEETWKKFKQNYTKFVIFSWGILVFINVGTMIQGTAYHQRDFVALASQYEGVNQEFVRDYRWAPLTAWHISVWSRVLLFPFLFKWP
jgi:hypothetical protein